jgi:hypothetical protein
VLALAALTILLGGCGRPDDAALAARSREVNTPNGPLVLGFWPGEPRAFALEKAQALAGGNAPASAPDARVVELPRLEVAGLPCVVELTFYQNRLLSVYVGFLTRDPVEIRRVQGILTGGYGAPTYNKPTANSEFQQWIVKKPLPFTVVSGAAPGQLFYVSCWDAGPLFQAALPVITANREGDERRVREFTKRLSP